MLGLIFAQSELLFSPESLLFSADLPFPELAIKGGGSVAQAGPAASPSGAGPLPCPASRSLSLSLPFWFSADSFTPDGPSVALAANCLVPGVLRGLYFGTSTL